MLAVVLPGPHLVLPAVSTDQRNHPGRPGQGGDGEGGGGPHGGPGWRPGGPGPPWPRPRNDHRLELRPTGRTLSAGGHTQLSEASHYTFFCMIFCKNEGWGVFKGKFILFFTSLYWQVAFNLTMVVGLPWSVTSKVKS